MNERTKELVEEVEDRATVKPREFLGGAEGVGYSSVGDMQKDALALCAEIRRLDEERAEERDAWKRLLKLFEFDRLIASYNTAYHDLIELGVSFDES